MHELISKSLSCLLCHDLEIKTLVVVAVGVGECKIVKQHHEIDYLREFKTIAGTCDNCEKQQKVIAQIVYCKLEILQTFVLGMTSV